MSNRLVRPAGGDRDPKSGSHPLVHDLLIVLGCALGLRLLFAAITAGTFDPDEFVILALSRDLSHGAVAYRDFMFFHPPGSLAVFAALQPLIGWWWPVGRLVTLLVDSTTAVFVWYIGLTMFGRREALAAGLLYAVSPLALVTGVRIGPDPFITALGMLGLAVLLSRDSRRAALLAGACLGLAIWIKYPALLFVPIYAVAAPRRIGPVFLGCVVTAALVFAPFVIQSRAFVDQTIVWQMAHRDPTQPISRVAAVGVYLMLLHPLALWGLLRSRCPRWLLIGFAVGGVFILASQVYYHYLLPMVPFAALLAAPRAAALVRRFPRRIVLLGALLFFGWAQDIAAGSSFSRLYISAYSFADVQRTAQLLRTVTAPGARLLTDHFEYGYLAGRVSANYFWNMRGVVGTHMLERMVTGASAVVLTRHIAATYPPGFVDFLHDRHYHLVRTRVADIWLLPPQRAH
jgi:hypothetical protein